MVFATYLAGQGLTWQTIKVYLAAIRHLHLTLGFPFPGLEGPLPRLQLLLRGVRRISSRTHWPRPRLPITPNILRRVYSHLSSQPCTWDRRMLWAAMCVCFFGFLRSGEVCTPSPSEFDPSTHLAPSDVSLDSREAPSRVYVQIKASKTDPFHTGVTIVLGATGRDLCPVAALTPYLALREPSPGPLFHFQNGSYLTRARFVTEVRQLLSTTGLLASAYSGHSFWIGAATTAALAGVEDHTIQTLGRWQSSAYLLYIRLPPDSLAGISG